MDAGSQVCELEVMLDCGDHAQLQTALESAALARIIEEVRNNEPSEPHAYNRMHNRHNR